MNIEISQIANLPSKFGKFKVKAFKEPCKDGCKEHLVIYKENLEAIPIVRVHSECLTGDALGSLKCDCRDQLEYALELADKTNGMVIYLRQEGRGIGLLNKINAYALQDAGCNTVEANHQLGFSADERTYEMVTYILHHFNIPKIKLLTNNPDKINSISDIEIVQRVPIIMKPNKYNTDYLKTKQAQMGHMLEE